MSGSPCPFAHWDAENGVTYCRAAGACYCDPLKNCPAASRLAYYGSALVDELAEIEAAEIVRAKLKGWKEAMLWVPPVATAGELLPGQGEQLLEICEDLGEMAETLNRCALRIWKRVHRPAPEPEKGGA